jgi:hypothetical protein
MGCQPEPVRFPVVNQMAGSDTSGDPKAAVAEQHLECRAAALRRFDQIRKLIETGRITDFLFIARDEGTKHFLTEIAINVSNATEIFAFVGVTDALKLELTERAQLAPSIMPDGSVLDPYEKELNL